MTTALLVFAVLVAGTCMGLWLGRTHRPRVGFPRTLPSEDIAQHLCLLMDPEGRVEESRRTFTGYRPPGILPRGHGRTSTFYHLRHEIRPRVWLYYRGPER